MQVNEVLEKLCRWADENESVRAMILTSSRVDPNAFPERLSNYDIELYVHDINSFMNDTWLPFWGDILIQRPLKPISTLDKDWIKRLVLFENGIRIDFQITSKSAIHPSDYNGGYKVG